MAESKMASFFRLLGSMKGDRDLYCSANVTDDFRCNEIAIWVTNNKILLFIIACITMIINIVMVITTLWNKAGRKKMVIDEHFSASFY
jgi:hypothetical protein